MKGEDVVNGFMWVMIILLSAFAVLGVRLEYMDRNTPTEQVE